MLASFARIALLVRHRDELQCRVEIFEEILLDPGGRGRHEVDGRGGGRRGLPEECGKRLRLVACLYLHHVWHVARIEELGAEDGQCERRRRLEVLLDAGRHFALPVGARDEIVASLDPRSAAADVAVVIGVAVDQLHRVVATPVDRRHRDHHRFGAQVQPQHRVRRVAVGRDDSRVLVGENSGFVADRVERRLVLPRVLVDHELVHHRVVHHDRQAVDERLLGDGLRLGDARRGDTARLVLLHGLCDRVVLFRAARDQHRHPGTEYDGLQESYGCFIHVGHPSPDRAATLLRRQWLPPDTRGSVADQAPRKSSSICARTGAPLRAGW